MSEFATTPPLANNGEETAESQDIFVSAIDDSKMDSAASTLPVLQLSSNASNPLAESPMSEAPLSPQPEEATSSSWSPPSKVQNGDGGEADFLSIKVETSSRSGDGMGAYMTFKVETHTNMKSFKKTHFSVLRRFSDFLGLHERLVEKYLRSGRIIPPAPQKSVIGATKIKISGPNDPNSPFDFLERRRAALERYIQRTAAHPVLGADPDLRDFLQNEAELPKATNTSALSGAGVMRLFNKVGETVSKITYRMDENDSWFEEKAQEIENHEAALKKLATILEALVEIRKELAYSTAVLSRMIALISGCEENRQLAVILVHLSEVQDKIDSITNEQASGDFTILCQFIKDYISLIGAVKDVFHERVKVYQNWQHSKLMLNKKRELKAKMELANKTEKGKTAANEIIEWESKVERCEEEFHSISQMIKKELGKFEVGRINDFKDSFVRYMDVQMKHQNELAQIWETFMTETRALS